MTRVRLQKFLSNAGVTSRRKAEALIESGHVSVNGSIVTQLGTKVDPVADRVSVDGEAVHQAPAVWVALNKPRGFVCTRDDTDGRPTIYDLLPEALQTLFYVGRLDVESEGLILLTNAGDAAHRMLHPSFRVPRVYDVIVTGQVAPDTLHRLLGGVELEDGMARAESVKLLATRTRGESRLRLVLREGRKREVRRMMRAVGHVVRRLRRISYGPVKLGRLPPGEWRRLSEKELRALPAGSKRAG